MKTSSDLTDFSKYPFPDPIEPTRPTVLEPTLQAGTQRHPAPVKNYSKLRQNELDLSRMEDYLQVYHTNQYRKSLLLHQELEEHYLGPISKRLTKKLNGESYRRYVREKARAVSAFDIKSQSRDTFLEKLPDIPVIELNTRELTDPILKYQKNQSNEERLAEIVARSSGAWTERVLPPPRETMDLKKWRILTETRFSQESDTPVPKGKKMFNVDLYKSQVPELIDEFAPAPPRKIRVKTRVPVASIDHIHFSEV
jgi:hypothetical protein